MSTCPTGKLIYETARAAHRALHRIRGRCSQKGAHINVYRCADCHAWHLGRSPQRGAKLK